MKTTTQKDKAPRKRAPRKAATPVLTEQQAQEQQAKTLCDTCSETYPAAELQGSTCHKCAEEARRAAKVDEGKDVYEWHSIRFDDSVKGIGNGWRHVLVEFSKDGKTVRVTETTGDKHKMSRHVFNSLQKGKVVRNNRGPNTPATRTAPRKQVASKVETAATTTDEAPKAKHDGTSRVDRFMEVLRKTGGGTAEELAKVMGVRKVTVYCTASEGKRKGYPIELKDKRYFVAESLEEQGAGATNAA